MKRIFIVALLIVIACYVTLSYRRSWDVKLKCSYMAYACGDCYPQFKVDTIFFSSPKTEKLLGQDVYLVYEKNGIRHLFDEEIDNCAICYDYYIEGVLKEHLLWGDKEIFVKDFKKILRNPNCCPLSVPKRNLKS